MLDVDDLPTYELLLVAGKPYGVDPSSSIECEPFFRAELLHDDTSFYLFVAPKRPPIVITQQL